jgi:DNA mismatch endonuclease (patch repair protein)
MADRITAEQRSRVMQSIKGKDTGPEVKLMALVRLQHERADCNLLTNVASLPGAPDILCVTHRQAFFVHGCFWHGCPDHYKEPQSNQAFWRPKIAKNKERDTAAMEALEDMGFAVDVFWEHELQ